jgi:hypothetical protein
MEVSNETDMAIMLEVNDSTLASMCLSSSEYRNICTSEHFWRERLSKRYPNVNTGKLPAKYKSWKDYYTAVNAPYGIEPGSSRARMISAGNPYVGYVYPVYVDGMQRGETEASPSSTLVEFLQGITQVIDTNMSTKIGFQPLNYMVLGQVDDTWIQFAVLPVGSAVNNSKRRFNLLNPIEFFNSSARIKTPLYKIQRIVLVRF